MSNTDEYIRCFGIIACLFIVLFIIIMGGIRLASEIFGAGLCSNEWAFPITGTDTYEGITVQCLDGEAVRVIEQGD